MTKAMHFKITGRVQGVFFRSETKRKADELGLTGWVRNRKDGSVEIFAQGREEKLKKLEAWCRRGPPGAKVENVHREEKELDETCGSFAIRYE